MAKSKNRKKKTPVASIAQINPIKYIVEAARKIPLYKVLSDYHNTEDGLKQFIVIRKKLSGRYLVGMYLIDIFCLGLKSTNFRESLSEEELEFFINQIFSTSGRTYTEMDPNLAFNVIYGAIEYAEDLGLPILDKDFAITEYILPDVETIDFVDVQFGKDGKPFFISGPFDNVPKTLAILDKSVGRGNYDYLIATGFDDSYSQDEDFEEND
jgi:hypothetical protein